MNLDTYQALVRHMSGTCQTLISCVSGSKTIVGFCSWGKTGKKMKKILRKDGNESDYESDGK